MPLGAPRIAEILARFDTMRIAVVGDFMADVYLDARPARLSREAPVMVVQYQGERMIPGGAANAVNNLVQLGARVTPVGVLGFDAAGDHLASFFETSTTGLDGVLRQADVDTVSKTRIMVGAENRSRQQILRIDREPARRVNQSIRESLAERLATIIPEVDAIILSDYGYGVLDASLVALVRGLGQGKIITGDSRYALEMMKGVTVAKPNHVEAESFCGFAVNTDEDAERAGKQILQELQTEALLLTRGNRGMMLLEQDQGPEFIAAADSPGEVTDVSGAGDTVVSVFTLALSAGATYPEAAQLANEAAGIVVGKLGAATVGPQELLRSATQSE